MLGTVGVQRQPLDVAFVRDRDRLVLLDYQVFHVHIGAGLGEFGAPIVAVLGFHLRQIGADDGQHRAVVAEQGFITANMLAQTVVFLEDFVPACRAIYLLII